MVLIAERNPASTTVIRKRLLISFSLGLLSLSAGVMIATVDSTQIIINMRSHVSNGSVIHDFLEQKMQGIHLSAYLFNITNAERFMAGKDHNLRVEEVGPFTYKETRTNKDLEIDEEARVIRYSPHVDLVFVPEESIGRPEDVNVTLPNLAMLGVASTMSSLPFSHFGFNMLTMQLKSKPIVTLSAHEYLWGYSEPLVTLANKFTPGLIHFEKLGLLQELYDTIHINRLELEASDEKKFMIRKRNGYTKLQRTHGEDPEQCSDCSDFVNTYEGFMYPSALSPETRIRIFRNGLCKVLDMVYHEERVMDNAAVGLVYNLSDSFYKNDPNDTRGLLDLSACFYNIPIHLSKLHFLDMDPKIYERIEGMKPDKKYESYIIIEPKMGVELKTFFPIQINLVLGDLSFNSAARRFSNLVLPLSHVAIIQPELPESTLHLISLIYVTGPIIEFNLKLTLFLLGLALIAYGLHQLYRAKIGLTTKTVLTNGKKILTNNVSAEEPLMRKEIK